jgi:hypothetical protein
LLHKLYVGKPIYRMSNHPEVKMSFKKPLQNPEDFKLQTSFKIRITNAIVTKIFSIPYQSTICSYGKIFHRTNIGIAEFHCNSINLSVLENNLFSLMTFLLKCDLEHFNPSQAISSYIHNFVLSLQAVF